MNITQRREYIETNSWDKAWKIGFDLGGNAKCDTTMNVRQICDVADRIAILLGYNERDRSSFVAGFRFGWFG